MHRFAGFGRFARAIADRALALVRPRLDNCLLAYAVFRMGYCKMAAEAMRGTDEAGRLTRDYQRYRGLACKLQTRSAAA